MTSSSDSNPFVGLRPFESDESLLFFGRQDQIIELLQRLHQFHFVAVIGSSGSGKSSLIRAGLIPRLKAGYMVNDQDRWAIALMKPGQSPICNLADAILQQVSVSSQGLTATDLEKKIKEGGVAILLQLLQPLWKDNTNFFLLVDQFEELFRFAIDQKELEKKDEAIDFVNLLLELSNQRNLSIYVVLTMRSDFIGDCAQFYGLPEAMNQSQFIVPRLNRVQLKSTIEGPIRLYKGKINAGLTVRLLNDAQLIKDELPLLQHALMRTWDYETTVDKNGELDLEDYQHIGGIEKALSNHADEALQGMLEEELRITKKIFQALTTIDEHGRKIRRPVRLSKLELLTGASRPQLLSLINRFIEDNRCFLVLTRVEEDYLIDISHESLIRQWGQLNSWVDEEADAARMFQRLTESATLYEEKKKDLLAGNELQQLLQWYHTFQPGEEWAQQYSPLYQRSFQYLMDSEKEWKADQEAKEKQRRRKIRNQRLLFMASLLVIIIISTFAVLLYRNNIRHKRELTLSYWNSSQTARLENRLLDAFHFIAAAVALRNNEDLTKSLLIDGEAFLPFACLKSTIPFNDIVTEVIWSPDGKKWLAVTNNGRFFLIDKTTGKELAIYNEEWHINSAAFSNDGKLIVAASNDATVSIWETTSTRRFLSIQLNAAATAAIFNHDNNTVITGSEDGNLQVWEVASGKKLQTFKPLAAPVTSLDLSKDGKRLLVSGKDGSLEVLDIATGKPLASWSQNGIINSAVFSLDDAAVLTASSDSTAILWEVSTKKPLLKFSHTAPVYSAAFSPDGKWILTASKDKTARLWNAINGKQTGAEMKHDGPVMCAAFSPDGKWILTGGQDEVVRVWNVFNFSSADSVTFLPHENAVNSVTFTGDNQQLLTASSDSYTRIWDIPKQKILTSLKHDTAVLAAIMLPRFKEILAVSGNATATVWNAATQKRIATLHQDGMTAAAFSPDGKQIITASENGSVYLWKTAQFSKGIPTDFLNLKTAIYCVNFSPDEKKIVLACNDSTAYLVNRETGKTIALLKHDDFKVSSAVFSPDGKKILTASWDGTARLWNAVSGRPIGSVMKHTAAVNSAVFSPDEKWILTAGWDSTAHLWSILTFKEIGTGKKMNDVINSISMSPDGRWIATGNNDKKAGVWKIAGDFDIPVELFQLQAIAITGVSLNTEAGEAQCLPLNDWNEFNQAYFQKGQDHFKTCQYPAYNVWKRIYPEEAKKVRPELYNQH